MTSYACRALLPAGLLVGLVCACAPLSRRSQRETPDTTQGQPPRGATLTAEDIARTPTEPIEMILQGRFPGVEVYRTAGGIAVRIRGTSSFYGSNEPLYVIDGVPIQPGPSGSLSGINPHDIASIQVVKDPVGTAMYGMRGANGVIVITTKRPVKRDST
jgi:iron complex outermembrane receptor protein